MALSQRDKVSHLVLPFLQQPASQEGNRRDDGRNQYQGYHRVGQCNCRPFNEVEGKRQWGDAGPHTKTPNYSGEKKGQPHRLEQRPDDDLVADMS